MISLNRTFFHKEAYDNVKRVMESGWAGLGPETSLFEKEVKDYLGCEYALATNSGTEALRLAVASLDLPKDTYAISTAMTFVSTNHVLVQNGLIPYFADIDPDTGNVTINSIYRVLNALRNKGKKVSLIMVVHFAGMPVDLEEIKAVASWYDLPIIEDCAHAFGASYHGKKIGADALLGAFSFHAVKNLATGDGGLVVTRTKELFERIKSFRWLGIDRNTYERTNRTKYSWDYDVTEFGYKAHGNDLISAIARGQLLHLDRDNAIRERLVGVYRKELEGVKGITLLNKPMDRQSSNHLFVIRCDRQADLMKAFDDNGIQFGHHYRPNYSYTIYKDALKDGDMEGTELYDKTAISLPLHTVLDEGDVNKVCETIRKTMEV